jgi:hypothetical protein
MTDYLNEFCDNDILEEVPANDLWIIMDLLHSLGNEWAKKFIARMSELGPERFIQYAEYYCGQKKKETEGLEKFPKWIETKKQWVIGEVCQCGHNKKEHDRIFFPLNNGKTLQEYNEGKCCRDGCLCDRYTWKEWILVAGDKGNPPIMEKEKEGGGIEYH